MFRTLKLLIYALIAAAIIFLYWFVPKYSYIRKNPSYCTNLTKHLYYCGANASLEKLFK